MSLFKIGYSIEIDLISDLSKKYFPLLKVWFLVFVAESARTWHGWAPGGFMNKVPAIYDILGIRIS